MTPIAISNGDCRAPSREIGSKESGDRINDQQFEWSLLRVLERFIRGIAGTHFEQRRAYREENAKFDDKIHLSIVAVRSEHRCQLMKMPDIIDRA